MNAKGSQRMLRMLCVFQRVPLQGKMLFGSWVSDRPSNGTKLKEVQRSQREALPECKMLEFNVNGHEGGLTFI